VFGFVDSHAHLADPAFDGDVEQVIDRARDAGARAVICVGESIPAAERAAALAARAPGFLAWTAGIHPHDAHRFDPFADPGRLAELVAAGASAIGECGLDYHYDHSPRDLQRRAFAAQLELARDTRRPVVVHSRDADVDTAAMVAEAGREGVRGVLHCFTGGRSLAETALDAGWFVSFSGMVTFARWDGHDVLRSIPLDRLLVESDAPYLAPVPNRGKRNEPAWVALTVARIAELREEVPAELGDRLAANAVTLFGLRAATVQSSGPR
jgi:TatD DNase family protein